MSGIVTYGGCTWCRRADTPLIQLGRARVCMFRKPCDARIAEMLQTARWARDLFGGAA